MGVPHIPWQTIGTVSAVLLVSPGSIVVMMIEGLQWRIIYRRQQVVELVNSFLIPIGKLHRSEMSTTQSLMKPQSASIGHNFSHEWPAYSNEAGAVHSYAKCIRTQSSRNQCN